MSPTSNAVNGALYYILAISVLMLFLITYFIIFFVVRYRKSRNPVAEELKSSKIVEAVFIGVPTVIVLTMFFYGLTGYQLLRKPPADSIIVKVTGLQWSWIYEHENGRKGPDMVVPLGKNIKCELTTPDVIHSFYVPKMRIQVDMVPGMKTFVWFKASEIGEYYVLCTQYCGLKHSAMISKIYVVPVSDYEAWKAGSNIALGGKSGRKMEPGMQLLSERGCLSCHSLDGTKMSGPTFQGLFGSKVVVNTGGTMREVTADAAFIRESIINPRADIVEKFANTMPPSRDLMSDEEIVTVTEFMKTLK